MSIIDGYIGDQTLDSSVVVGNLLLKLFRKSDIVAQRQTGGE